MAAELEVLLEVGAEHGEDPIMLRSRAERGRAILSERFGVTIGELETGAAADLVVRGPERDVQHVIVDGRVVVESGTLVAADLGAIESEARRQAERLWQRMATL